MDDVPHGGIIWVSESTDIAISTIRCWQRELLQDSNWRPYACTHLPESRSINAQQELDLAERLRVEDVSAGQYYPPATANYLALAMNAESRAPECNAP
jgi:hypothetical protein